MSNREELLGQVPAQYMKRMDDEIPEESVPLPSEGKAYPANHPLHNKETVDIKVMTARQEDILTNRALIKKGTVITELLKSCLIDRAVDPGSLLVGDRNAMLVALRITGYGSEYPVEVECNECGHINKEHMYSLSKLPIRSMKLQPVEPFTNKFEFNLPVSGKKVWFKFLTGADEEELSNLVEKMKQVSGGTNNQSVSLNLKYHIVAIDGDESRSEVDKFIRTMRAKDSLALRKYINQHEPMIEMKQEYECPACSYVTEMGVPMGVSFFWPEQ